VHESSNVVHFELFMILLATVVALELAARRLNLPPAAAFIIGGIAFAFIPGLPSFTLDPDLVLILFLPPLLLSSAYFTPWREFKRNLSAILQLAIGAVAFTTAVVGVITHWIEPSLPWAACFALGAIVSPPDAVAAKAVLQRLSLPPRMMLLLEGESLVNDASGLVLFKFAVAAALTGVFNLGEAVTSFGILTAGGILIGYLTAKIESLLLTRLKDPHMAIIGTFLGAWIAYIAAEAVHTSGVLSCVTCGLIVGWKQHEALSATVRTEAVTVWSFVTFILESMVFILIGLSLRGIWERLGGWHGLSDLIPAILAITTAVIVTRFIWIFAAVYIPRSLFPSLRVNNPFPPVSVPIVMSWAGMRGVVSLAAALSLPEHFPGRDFILAISFIVILVTVLLQGTTLGPLIQAFGISKLPHMRSKKLLTLPQARHRMINVQLDAIKKVSTLEDGSERHPRLVEQYTYRANISRHFSASEEELRPHRDAHFTTILSAISAGRAEVIRMHRQQEIDDNVLRTLERQLDLEEMSAWEFMES